MFSPRLVNHEFFKPTTNSQNVTAPSIPKPNASVLDIFDYSRDDPFERVQMNAIDDMAELREVLEKSQTPPNEPNGTLICVI